MRFVEDYLLACLDEWLYRKGRDHGIAAFYSWHVDSAPRMKLPDAGI